MDRKSRGANRERLGLAGLVFLASVVAGGCGGGGGPAASSNGVSSRQDAAALRAARAEHTILTAALGDAGASMDVLVPTTGRTLKTPAMQGQEPDSGLYYTVTIQMDGSGQQLFFSDSARTDPAGTITWDPPQWTGNVAGRYPVTLTFHVTQVDGESGDVTLTLTDRSETIGNVVMHLADSFANNQAGTEDSVVDLALADTGDTGSITVTDQDGTVTDQVDQSSNGDETGTFSDSAGDTGSIDMSPDESATSDAGQGNDTTQEDVSSNGDVTIMADGSINDGGNLDEEDPTVDVPADSRHTGTHRKYRLRTGVRLPLRKP